MPLFELICFILYGAVLGSFTTAYSHRIKNNQGWIVSGEGGIARSNCPHCEHQLSFLDMLPIISWFIMKGSCRYCRIPISKLYPAVEGLFISLSLVLYSQFSILNGAILLTACPFIFVLLENLILRQKLVLSAFILSLTITSLFIIHNLLNI